MCMTHSATHVEATCFFIASMTNELVASIEETPLYDPDDADDDAMALDTIARICGVNRDEIDVVLAVGALPSP